MGVVAVDDNDGTGNMSLVVGRGVRHLPYQSVTPNGSCMAMATLPNCGNTVKRSGTAHDSKEKVLIALRTRLMSGGTPACDIPPYHPPDSLNPGLRTGWDATVDVRALTGRV